MSDETTSERDHLETLIESHDLADYIGDDVLPALDPCSPVAALFAELAERSDDVSLDDSSLDMERIWRAARENGLPLSAAVSHAISDTVRARAFGRILDRWQAIPAGEKARAGTVRDALVDPDTQAIFLGILHRGLVADARRAAGERAAGIAPERATGERAEGIAPEQAAGERAEGIRASDAENAGVAGQTGVGLQNESSGGPHEAGERSLGEAVPQSADTLCDCERLVLGLENAETGVAFQIIARLADGGDDAVAWLTYVSERDYRVNTAMVHRIRALMRLDTGRAVRLASGLFRSDEHRGEPDESVLPLYNDLLDLLLDSGAPEVMPLLVFLFEPGGKLVVSRERAGTLRERVRQTPQFRTVRRLLRRLQRGEPVLVPAGVDFERFVGAELRRLGYESGTPDPQVLVDIRKRWQEAMHEGLQYRRPVDIPDLSFDDILGTPEPGTSVGSFVEKQSENDPDWIVKPAEDGGEPRIVAAYAEQERVYGEAGLQRLHDHQVRFTARDLVVRGAWSLADGEVDRASLYARSSRLLDPGDPFAAALVEHIEKPSA
ncbi:MAG: hypothetical protein ACLFM0_10410 [Spirochaetales bacterium]